jgi:hypothetical protein
MPASIPGRVAPKRRTFEIPADVHDAAAVKALEVEHRYLTDVIRELLQQYGSRTHATGVYAWMRPPERPIRQPGGRGMKKVSARIEDTIWNPALKKAHGRGDSLAAVVTRGLSEYVMRP